MRPRAGKESRYREKLAKLEATRRKELLGRAFATWKSETKGKPELQGGEDLLGSLSGLIKDPTALDLVEDVLILGYELTRGLNLADYTVAALSFIKRRTKESLVVSALRSKLMIFLKNEISGGDDTSMQGGFEDALKQGRDLHSYWPRLRASPLWRKIQKVLVFTTASTMFGFEISNKQAVRVEKEYYKNRCIFNMDFTHSVLDLLLFVAERGFQIFKTGRFDEMFHSGTAYEAWYERAAEIISKAKFLSNPEAHGIDIHSFTAELDKLIAQGTSMYKYACELDKISTNLIRSMNAQLQLVRANFLNKKNAQKTRRAPFTLLVEGHSSIGKTTFANIMHYFYGALMGKDISLGCRYTRNAVAKYWDGYTSDQWSILLDDIGFLKPGVGGEIDPTLQEVILIINNAPYTPDMAALEDKGSAPFRGDLVVGTTNTPDLNLHAYFAVPAAVARRFPYHIRLRPRQDLLKNRTMIDETKLPPMIEGQYPDWWTIEVLVPISIPMDLDGSNEWRQTVEYQTLTQVIDGRTVKMENLDMKSFLKWLGPKILEHNTIQGKVAQSELILQQTRICMSCFQPQLDCACAEPDLTTPRVSSVQGGMESPVASMLGLFLGYFLVAVFGNIVSFAFIALKVFFYFQPQILQSRAFIMWVRQRLYEIRFFLWGWRNTVYYGKEQLRLLGQRVQAKFDTPLVCYSVSGALGAVIAAYVTYQWVRDRDVQGGLSSTLGSTPVVEKPERESVWVKNEYEVSHFDMGTLSLSWNQLDPKEVRRVLLRNCVFLRVFDGLKWRTMKAIGLGGQFYLTTNHTIPDLSTPRSYEVVRSKVEDGVTPNVRAQFSSADVVRDVSKDVAIVRLRNVPPVRDITELFIGEKCLKFFGKAYYVGRNKDGSEFERSVVGVKAKMNTVPDLGITLNEWFGTVQQPTENGDCGAALVLDTPMGPAIGGIHQLGIRNLMSYQIGAIVITREYLREVMHGMHLISPSEPLMDTPTTKSGELIDLAVKSPIRFIEEGEAAVYGSLKGFRATPRSHVRETQMCDAMQKRGYVLEHGRPQMKGWKPWNIGLQELTRNSPNIDSSIVDICASALVDDWMKVDKRWLRELMIYDDKVVVNGLPGLRFVDRMNLKTSAGFPWRKSKRFLVIELEPDDLYSEPVEFNDEVMNRVNERMHRYLADYRTHPVFVSCLKDEALKLVKCRDGRTRIFMAGSADFIFLMRKVLLSFVRVVQKNKFVFESAPGTEAQSVEWDWFYQFLTQHGVDRCIFGDFRGFDISMNAVFILAAFWCIEEFHRRAGCSEDHLKLIRGIAYDIAFALVDFNGDLIEFFGKNPSGQALTVIINGIVNCLYMRYVYYRRNPDHEVSNFQEMVALITYGDDNGMNVSESVPWFNHSSIRDELAVIGVTYTMADKEAESVPYIPISQGSFLKRSWRWEEFTRTYVCPLEESSIVKSLMIGVRSKSVDHAVQCVDIVHCANSEWFWHGREVFEKQHEMLKEILVEAELIPYQTRELESWDELMLRYMDNSRTFLADADTPSFVRIDSYRLEGGEEHLCDRCHRIDCEVVANCDEIRLCMFCRHCRFDDSDIDCAFCGFNDVCQRCLVPSDTTRPRIGLLMLAPSQEFCDECAHLLLMAYLATHNSEVQGGTEFPHVGAGERPPVGLEKAKSPAMRQLLPRLFTLEDLRRMGRIVPAGALVLRPHHRAHMLECRKGNPSLVWVDHGRLYWPATTTTTHGGVSPSEETADNVSRVDWTSLGQSAVHQTIEFKDGDVGESFSFAPPSDEYFGGDDQRGVDLGKFLSRPTLIKTFSWLESGFGETSFDPWTLFLNTSQIKSKLNNFAFLRGNLKIKVVMNAAPFYYGALLVAYTPLPNNVLAIGSVPNKYVLWSQRPHIWIYPQNNAGGEMELPFFYPKNYVDVTSASSVADLGALRFIQYTTLRSANGATSNGVTLQVYAWMEDPVLTGPTVKAALQGGDEYGNGPVSGPATAVAHWSQYLSRLPLIGRFAKATSIGAAATSQIAKLFGWTNVPVIDNVQPFKNLPFHDLASAHVSEPTSKFYLDPKGELSVDPGIVGLGPEDELSIARIVQRESYLTTSTWNTSDAIGTLLFSSAVTPMLGDIGTASAAGTYSIAPTPMAWLSQMFNHWRGDVIFRIKIIGSQYHRGRLRITWDPLGDLSATTDYSHVAFTKVIDLGESDDFEFRIPYLQTLPWLAVPSGLWAGNLWSTSSYVTPTASANGGLTVRVLTNLSAPVDTAPVSLLVFVRGAETLEFANPRDLPNTCSFYEMQGGEELVETKLPHDERYLTNFGEAIPSLRVLLRRSVLCDSIPADGLGWVATDWSGIYRAYQSRLPASPGYDTGAYTFAKGVETPAVSYKFNYTNMTHLAWVSSAFIALRGSVRWHFNVEDSGGTALHSCSVYRTPGLNIAANSNELELKYVSTNATGLSSQTGQKSSFWKLSRGRGLGGVMLTNGLTQTGISVELPMMTNYKFQLANPRGWLLGSDVDGSISDTYQVDVMVHPSSSAAARFLTLQRYVCAGTDFNLHFFLNAPYFVYNVAMGQTYV